MTPRSRALALALALLGCGSSGSESGTGGTNGSGGAAAGATGTGGTSTGGNGIGGTAAGGTTGTAANICTFASGINVPWVNFGGDVPNPNIATFNALFSAVHAAGGRVVRWWFHANGYATPGYDSSGLTQKIPQSHIDGVKAILAAANSAGLAVNVSLWSFDMLQGPGSGETIPAATLTNNQNLLTVDVNRQAYIDNYLTPLVMALQGTPGLYSYEIFNEPEGMTTEHGWTANSTNKGLSVPEAMIQKTVNWFAAAIHAADPTVLVTNGSQTFDYCSNVSGKTNYYSDAALRSAGGKQTGTLDFYEVHYYTSNGTSDSCFLNPASHWALDKKLVMGEFAAAATDNVAVNDLFTTIFTGGYDGAWAWSYNSDDPWPAGQQAMQNLYTAQTAVISACP
ncbi:MAG TPA: cellulase family glycosylhydrolase [Polyangia bacterium]|nr:cellulase family glycosylhydrolase [Polyangia bacterium]